MRRLEILTNKQLLLVIAHARKEIKAGRNRSSWLLRLGKYTEMLDERFREGTYTPHH